MYQRNYCSDILFFFFFFISIINKLKYCPSGTRLEVITYFPSVISMAEQMEVGLAAADAMQGTEYEAGAAPDILVSEISLCLFLLGDNYNWCSHVKEDCWLPPM